MREQKWSGDPAYYVFECQCVRVTKTTKNTRKDTKSAPKTQKQIQSHQKQELELENTVTATGCSMRSIRVYGRPENEIEKEIKKNDHQNQGMKNDKKVEMWKESEN